MGNPHLGLGLYRMGNLSLMLGRKTLNELEDELMPTDVPVILQDKCYACDDWCARGFVKSDARNVLHMLMAGFPCVDFTKFGKGLRTAGKSAIVIIALAKLVLTIRPNAVILENVEDFPEAVMEKLLGYSHPNHINRGVGTL